MVDSKPAQAPARTVRPFATFVVLYVTAFMLEMVEHWTDPVATGLFLIGALALFAHITRARFLAFVLASTIFLLGWRFPEVANHVNLIICVNLALAMALAHSLLRHRGPEADAEFYEAVQPILRLTIIVTFSVAGFHKLNFDFLNPAVSCIATFSSNIWSTLSAGLFGIAINAIVIAGAIGLFCIALIWRERQHFRLPAPDWPAIVAPIVGTVAGCAVLFLLIDRSTLASPRDTIVFAVAVGVLCWQIVECLLLLVPRFQWVALALSLVVHAQLAMIRIVDFQSIALALLVAFVPPAVWRAWGERAYVRLGPATVHRAILYFALNMAGGLVMFVHHAVNPIGEERFTIAGLLFNAGVLVLLWPILSDLFSKHRSWTWSGVGVLNGRTPAFLYFMPLALLVFGMTSHLGLRTAGNFSMFSNLRTEGATSNHVLFQTNPLKMWGFQEDVVTVVAVDDRSARIGHHYVPLEGKSLPVVEFRKLLYEWREAGRIVPMTLVHSGRTERSADIASDPRWRVDSWDWQMRLMDFRVIQTDRPNRCRW